MRVHQKPAVEIRDWHPLFVWKPRMVGETWVWLETIERRWIPPARESGACFIPACYEDLTGYWVYRLLPREEG